MLISCEIVLEDCNGAERQSNTVTDLSSEHAWL
jgi:hypothetical protein